MTWIDLVKKYFPNVTDEEAEFILWQRTTFPMVSAEKVEQQLSELRNQKTREK